jgi:2-polyprenyl-3-methyl-5-hydroxy-6-metoxy-1,4-benzoquinol methylase
MDEIIFCPDCDERIYYKGIPKCKACGWQGEKIGNVLSLLASDKKRDAATEAYTKIYDKISSDDIAQQIVDRHYHTREALKFAFYSGAISGLDIADVGSGRGVVINSLVSEGGAKSITGIDISMPYLKLIAEVSGVRAIQANAEKLPFYRAFDIIISSDVMEHILNLGSYLVSINRALRVGGQFIVRVPYRENLLQYAAQLGAKYPFVHLRTYNKKLLIDDMRHSGFKVENIYYDGQFLSRPRKFFTGKPLEKSFKWLNETLNMKDVFADSSSYFIELYKKIFFEPITIVAKCRKKYEIEHVQNSSGAYNLICEDSEIA